MLYFCARLCFDLGQLISGTWHFAVFTDAGHVIAATVEQTLARTSPALAPVCRTGLRDDVVAGL
jgi:hypothetical protein